MKIRSPRGPCLLAMLLASPALAATPEPTAPLRWAQVVAALAHHPLVREAEARSDGAAGAVWTAQEVPNPAVSFTGGEASPRSGPGSRFEWGVSVELPLDFLATRPGRVAAARASAEAVSREGLGVRAEALRALRRSFVALAHAQALLEAETALEAQGEQLAALVRRRTERGEARPTEVARAELELERLRATLDRARAGAEARRRRLSAEIASPVTRVEADLAQALALPPLDDVRRRVEAEAPALQAGRARIAAAGGQLGAARWDRLPKLSVGASRVDELDRTATSLTATLTVPLFSWNAGRIRQAEADLSGEQARLEAAARELAASASESWHACAGGQAAARRYRVEVLPRAEEIARTMGRAFELGEVGLLDAIDTRRVQLDARREYLGLLLEMQNACGDLAALAGLELP